MVAGFWVVGLLGRVPRGFIGSAFNVASIEATTGLCSPWRDTARIRVRARNSGRDRNFTSFGPRLATDAPTTA